MRAQCKSGGNSSGEQTSRENKSKTSQRIASLATLSQLPTHTYSENISTLVSQKKIGRPRVGYAGGVYHASPLTTQVSASKFAVYEAKFQYRITHCFDQENTPPARYHLYSTYAIVLTNSCPVQFPTMRRINFRN